MYRCEGNGGGDMMGQWRLRAVMGVSKERCKEGGAQEMGNG